VKIMVEYHQCVNKEQDIFNQAVSLNQDGRKDLLERKFCNLITGTDQKCAEDMIGQCYDEKQAQVWTDMNLEVILDFAESLFSGWDSMKCPILRDHLQRREMAIIDERSDSECNQVRAEFNQCRNRAQRDYVNALRDGWDGRPDWEARKFCNLITDNLLDCPKILFGQCYTEDQITKMNFWEVIDESPFRDFQNWDTGKCPAVKKQISRWKAVVAGNETSLFPDTTTGPIELHILPILKEIISIIKKAFQKQPICTKNLIDHSDCLNKVLKSHDSEMASGNDGRQDWIERKICNFLTNKKEKCDEIVSSQCFTENEKTYFEDGLLEVYADHLESYTENWNSEKCPAFTDYLQRKEEEDVNTSNNDVCDQDKQKTIECNKKAMREFMSSLLFVGYDGRPNYKERKLCNFVTGTINCNHMLLGHCYTESDIARISFYDLHDEAFARDYPAWDTEKCPAVKEHLALWEEALQEDYLVFSSKQEGHPIIISTIVDALSISVD